MLRAPVRWAKAASASSLLIYTSSILMLAFVLLYHSGTDPGGLSAAEAAARSASRSLYSIYNQPLNAPHSVLLWAVQKMGFHSREALRLSSAIAAAVFALAFWSLAKNWFGKTVGLLATIVFVSTPIFIVSGRQASAEIMLLWPILLMAAYGWLARSPKRQTASWLTLMAASGLAIYTPGMIWWLVVGIVLARRRLMAVLAGMPRWLAASGVLIFIALLVPAGHAAFSDWHQLRGFAALPSTWASPLTIVKQISLMILGLLIKTPYHSQLIIARLPLLDIVQIALSVFGFYALWTAARDKALVLAAGIVFGVLAAAINNQVDMLILCLPAVGIVVAAGLRYLFIEWRNIFPANPIPKTLALTLMAGLVAAQLVFGATYGVVAWPHTVDTRTSYVLK